MEQKLILKDKNYITYKTFNFDTENRYNFEVLNIHGFASSMESKKSTFIEVFCQKNKIDLIKFNLSGHGTSSGELIDFTLSDWIENTLEIIRQCSKKKILIFCSSIGAWIGFITALKAKEKICGIVACAPALDFVNDYLEPCLSKNDKTKDIVFSLTLKDLKTLIITKKFYNDSQQYHILDDRIDLNIPIRLIHGGNDDIINFNTSVKIFRLLNCDDVNLTLIKDARHNLTRGSDLRQINTALLDVVNVLDKSELL